MGGTTALAVVENTKLPSPTVVAAALKLVSTWWHVKQPHERADARE